MVVQPFASLINRVGKNCPRLFINRKDAIPRKSSAEGVIDFEGKESCRDITYVGDCDPGCEELAEKLGWASELHRLMAIEHDRLDTKVPNYP